MSAFNLLKERLISVLVGFSLGCSLSFELMCDASDMTMGEVLGQMRGKVFHTIYYASRMLDEPRKIIPPLRKNC